MASAFPQTGLRTGLHLAVEVDGDGAHPAAWRAAGRPPSAALSARALARLVNLAETAGFALVTLDDGPLPPRPAPDSAGRLEAGVRAAYLSALTDRIGLAPTLHATTTEPFHLATQLASLDHLSLGRGAWVVGASDDPAALATVDAPARDADATRRETAEVIETARRLWDSWEDDAVIKDRATARYLDADRVHHIDFQGEFFSVVGPLISPRPPQGQLVVAGADTLGVTDQLDIALVSAVHLSGNALSAVDRDQLAERVGRARAAGVPLVFAELEVALDTDQPAEQRLRRLDDATPWPSTGRARYTGPALGLVETLRELAGLGLVDGVRLHPAVLPVDLPVLAEQVLPALAAEGLLTRPAPGATLRETLGLPKPVNRFAAPAPVPASRQS